MTTALPGVIATAAMAVGVAFDWPLVFVVLVTVLVLLDLVAVSLYLYATRVGKHRIWADILDSVAWRGDERGLDLGCGRGAVLIALARRLPRGHVIGVDIWEGSDQSGNAKDATECNALIEGVADRVEVETGDIRDLAFPADAFDVVTSSLVLHNLHSADDRAQVLANAIRVLKPGGRLLLADIRNIEEYERVLERFGASNVAVRDFGFRACFGMPRLRLVSSSKRGIDQGPMR